MMQLFFLLQYSFFSDIRHKFEKKLKRKLTVEEKKVFIKLSQEYICEIFMNNKNGNDENDSAVTGLSRIECKQTGSMSKSNESPVQKDKSKSVDNVDNVSENPSSSLHMTKTGPSHKHGRHVDSLTSPNRVKSSSFVGKSVCSRPVNPHPPSSTEDQWLNCSTPPSSGKRKRDISGSDSKLNRGAKRQQLEDEERSWLGMEGVGRSGWVSTAAGSATGSTGGKGKGSTGKSR